MSKYVKAVQCAEIISEELNISLYDLVDIFGKVPAADVVEVVRCRKCKHCNFYYPVKPIDGEAIGTYFCKVLERYTNPTNFCSYGEKKEK